jgi:hypothetical protein
VPIELIHVSRPSLLLAPLGEPQTADPKHGIAREIAEQRGVGV